MQLHLKRRVRTHERNNSTDTNVCEEGGGGGASGAGAEIFPPQLVVKTKVADAGCPSADHGCSRWSRYAPAACGAPRTGAGACPKEAVILWGARAGAVCGELSPVGGTLCWSRGRV